MKCMLYQLGHIDYWKAYDIQERLWTEKYENHTDDALLVLEHPPTLTIGKSGKLDNLLVDREALAKKGVSLFFTDRGGDITYHGPGQLVVYPIIDLTKRGKDIHRYIHELQEVIIRTLADFEIKAKRDEEYVGVWVEKDKIAAIGVRVKRWITMHGLALNVNPDLGYYSLINSCGILDRGVTSISKVLSDEVSIESVTGKLINRFSEVFETDIELKPIDSPRCMNERKTSVMV